MMFQKYDWWLPDGDDHFGPLLDRSISKGYGANYQRVIRRAAIGWASNRKVAIDVGAHVGFWTRDLCDQFDKVIAIEPVIDFFNCLEKNVQTKNLRALCGAVGNMSGWVLMNITCPGNSGCSHVICDDEGRPVPGSVFNTPTRLNRRVWMDRIDSFIGPEDDIGLIKIDCEGMEGDVIRGGLVTIARCKPVIVFEQKKFDHNPGSDPIDGVALLQKMGAVVLEKIGHDVIMGWLHQDRL